MNNIDIEKIKELREQLKNCNDHKEKKKIYQKIYYIKNRERIKNKSKEYYKNNSEEIKKYKKNYYKNNSEKINLDDKLKNDKSRIKADNHGQRWYKEEINLLYHYYIKENKSPKEIAELMGRTIKSIEIKLNENRILRKNN